MKMDINFELKRFHKFRISIEKIKNMVLNLKDVYALGFLKNKNLFFFF